MSNSASGGTAGASASSFRMVMVRSRTMPLAQERSSPVREASSSYDQPRVRLIR
ncbi:hypothetical protein [Azospirillum oryzae]|uniref:hypothetical protein n=1 Tax=Azospirillum oryzae TaxID=286727 RepID=UPI00142DDDB0|nr:hypothetical protein [Azospirillum oryzae]